MLVLKCKQRNGNKHQFNNLLCQGQSVDRVGLVGWTFVDSESPVGSPALNVAFECLAYVFRNRKSRVQVSVQRLYFEALFVVFLNHSR
jgi:hypothetical protein